MLLLQTPPADRHSLIEDALALLTGTLLIALSVQFLTHNALITGQIAGLSMLISYPTGWGFGAVFFVLNLPFYILAYKRMGPRFTLKTFIAVALMSGFATLFSQILHFETLPPLLGAVLFGVCAGSGFLVLFRHGASLGGIGVVALYLQDKTGFKAGKTQLIVDTFVFILAFFLFPPMIVVYSLIGALVLNVIILTNHRRDRYIAS